MQVGGAKVQGAGGWSEGLKGQVGGKKVSISRWEGRRFQWADGWDDLKTHTHTICTSCF